MQKGEPHTHKRLPLFSYISYIWRWLWALFALLLL